MERDGACFSAVLPKPLPAGVEYSVAALDRAQVSWRSPLHRARAQTDPAACSTPFLDQANVESYATASADGQPPGLSKQELTGRNRVKPVVALL